MRFRRRPSSLYTFPPMRRAWLGIATCEGSPNLSGSTPGFPDPEHSIFFKSVASTSFATPARRRCYRFRARSPTREIWGLETGPRRHDPPDDRAKKKRAAVASGPSRGGNARRKAHGGTTPDAKLRLARGVVNYCQPELGRIGPGASQCRNARLRQSDRSGGR